MLKFLRISNLAVITDVSLECEPGLNLLTGETGSGKSIIVDALCLLLGARASQDLIRAGEGRAVVEAVFDLNQGTLWPVVLTQAGIDPSGGEIILRREIQRDGPTRAFVNDRLASATLLKELGPHLVDVYGQGDHQTLLSPAAQMELLDEIAQAVQDRSRLNHLYEQYSQKREQLSELVKSESERWRLVDVYRYQIGEIQQIDPSPGEDEELETERRILQQSEKLLRLTTEAYNLMYEAEGSMLSHEAQVRRWCEELSHIDDRFNDMVDQLERVKVQLEETALFLRGYRDGISGSPERLQQVEDRLAELQRLKRKYGHTIEDVLAQCRQMRERLGQFESAEDTRSTLETEIHAAEAEYGQLARCLSERRAEAARQLERVLVKEMRSLAMEHGRFAVSLIPAREIPCPNGAERVEFLVSLNPGEDLKPLSRVASGGELSRIMLAIKSVSSARSGPHSLVFDEIDAGIGGRVAERVGQRLKELAGSHQVFCVTHQAQIARFAETHFFVEKHVGDGRSQVRVTKLDRTGRIDELARMMAGSRITPVTRRHAREMLQAGR